MLRDPRHNKGLAFSEKEREAHYLKGLLPPVVISQELQVSRNFQSVKQHITIFCLLSSPSPSGLQEKRLLHILRQYTVPLHRYMAMMDLQVKNSWL